MLYQIDKIIRDTRIALNANPKDEPWLTGPCNLTLDEVICANIESAAVSIIADAETGDIDNAKALRPMVCWEDSSGWLLLPHEFMRLVSFKMSDWHIPVTSTITPEHSLYTLQRSSFAGLRGTPERPVCAIVNRRAGRTLEFYSCRDTQAVVEIALYAPYPRISPEGAIDLPQRLYHKFVIALKTLVNNIISNH